MFKKFCVSAVLAVTVMGGLALGSDTAVAATQGAGPFVPAGVYPSNKSCLSAGDAGYPQGRWIAWYCEAVGGGQYLLWVEPIN
ncbi:MULTISPECIES: hypothetical protein [Streptomyces]|uniref:hypothetical protein n=1 Tax=Streptomyces TaxID=1883 RepID=UPI002FDBFBAC